MSEEAFDLMQCLERAKGQEQDAMCALVERLYPLVIRTVRAHLGDSSLEEDLAQDIFVKLFGRLDRYQPQNGVPFEHWVYRLALRTCLDALRAKRRRPEVRWSDLGEEQRAWLEFVLADESPPPDAMPGSSRELLEKLLSQLSVADRMVITLLNLEGRPVDEVARLTGWSRSSVKVRAFRARRRLLKHAHALGAMKYDEDV
jgi:RNA polymerase sigma factor (sigma-70 family)